MVVGRGEVVRIEAHDIFVVRGVVLVHAEGGRIKIVFLDVVLDFIMDFEIFEVMQCLGATSELVVNLEFATEKGKIVEGL